MKPLFKVDSVTPFRVVLVGYPNVGKSSLFAQISGVLNQIMNVPHSTVEVRHWVDPKNRRQWFDTPGVEPGIIEGLESILNQADLLVWVVDVTQWNRQKKLLSSWMKFNKPIVVVFTLFDLLPSQARHLLTHKKWLFLKEDFLKKAREPGFFEEISQAFDPQEFLKEFNDFHQLWEVGVRPHLNQILENHVIKWDRFFLFSPLANGLVLCLLIMIVGVAFGLGSPSGRIFSDFLFQIWSQLGEAFLSDGFLRYLWQAVGVGLWQGLIPFIPLIFLMSLILASLEDAGLWARVMILWDKFLRRIGLNGSSLLPLLAAQSCVLNGIVLSRNLEPSVKNRLFRILPLSMCSAKLPLMAATIAVLWPNLSGFLQGLILVFLVAINWTTMFFVGWLFNDLRNPQENVWVKYPLPLWQVPKWSIVWKKTWWQTWHFIEKVWPVVIVVSLLASSLERFPYLRHLTNGLHFLTWPFGGDSDWIVGILAGFVARELFWPTVLALKSLESRQVPLFLSQLSLGSKVALIVFFLLAFECLSTFLMLKRQGVRWKELLKLWSGNLLLTWILALIFRLVIDALSSKI